MRYDAILLMVMTAGACTTVPDGSAAAATLTAAMPAARGDAGPYRHVTVTTTRPPGKPEGTFAVQLVTPDGRHMTLPGPDEPQDFFLLDPVAVLFAPVDRSRQNGVVVLYDSSQIGPGNGTDRHALVYRIGAGAATRLPAMEARLMGARTAAVARARLAGARR